VGGSGGGLALAFQRSVIILRTCTYLQVWHSNAVRTVHTGAVWISEQSIISLCSIKLGARGSAFGWGTAPQAGRPRFRFPMMSLDFFHWHNPSGRTMALGSTQSLAEMSTTNVSWEWRLPVRRADNLTTFMCRLSWNLGASASWNPQGLSRPVMGLLYLYLYLFYSINWSSCSS